MDNTIEDLKKLANLGAGVSSVLEILYTMISDQENAMKSRKFREFMTSGRNFLDTF